MKKTAINVVIITILVWASFTTITQAKNIQKTLPTYNPDTYNGGAIGFAVVHHGIESEYGAIVDPKSVTVRPNVDAEIIVSVDVIIYDDRINPGKYTVIGVVNQKEVGTWEGPPTGYPPIYNESLNYTVCTVNLREGETKFVKVTATLIVKDEKGNIIYRANTGTIVIKAKKSRSPTHQIAPVSRILMKTITSTLLQSVVLKKFSSPISFPPQDDIKCDLKVRKAGGDWTDGPIDAKIGDTLEFKGYLKTSKPFIKCNAFIALTSNIIKVNLFSISPPPILRSKNRIVWSWFSVPQDFEKCLTFKCRIVDKGKSEVFFIVVGQTLYSARNDIDKIHVESS